MNLKRFKYFNLMAIAILFPIGSMALPEYPSIDRNTELMTNGGQNFSYPYIPSRRTTGDGRVSIGMHKGGGINLFVPEKIVASNVLETTAGVHINALKHELKFEDDKIAKSLLAPKPLMQTICDGTKSSQPYFANRRSNPYACDDDRKMDCYDLTVISFLGNRDNENPLSEFWGRDIRVKVSNPKTEFASLEEIEYLGDEPVLGARMPFRAFWEPMVTDDGELFVGRAGQSNHTWTDNEGVTHTKRYDIMYSKLDEGRLPCDVTGFKHFYPMAYAHKDPRMQEYGIAKYPIRDPSGNIIPHHEDLKVTYPWIDRAGNNLFFTSKYSGFHYYDEKGNMNTRYPKRCYSEGENCQLKYSEQEFVEKNIEPAWGYANFGYVGLWSLGKMVLIDGMINANDYNVQADEQYKWQMKLFKEEGQGRDGWMKSGNGRNLGSGNFPPELNNLQFFGSLEHLFNYKENMKPVSPRDVSWIINSGIASQELSFDRQLDRRYMVHIDGNATMSHPYYTNHPQSYAQMKYHDGFRFINNRTKGAGFVDPVYFQNAAASIEMNIPKHITASENIRVEPLAQGGINGKGIWLDGQSSIGFEIPSQSFDYSKKDFYFGMYFDDRSDYNFDLQEIMTFTDGTQLMLYADSYFLLFSQTLGIKFLPFESEILNNDKSFNHIGVQIEESGKKVTFYLNGLSVGSLREQSRPLISIGPGYMSIGKQLYTQGAKGWIDDFVMVVGKPNVEFKCNEANGFLVNTKDFSSPYYNQSLFYPQETHDEINANLASNGFETQGNFVCFTNYQDRDGLPRGFASDEGQHERVSTKIHFPEKDFKWNAPRPDSTRNNFCLSCHTADRKGGLGLAALREGEGPMVNDTRRQPNMWPMFISGNIPKDHYGPGFPSFDTQMPAAGMQLTDYFLFR